MGIKISGNRGNILDVKSKYILQEIFSNLQENKLLDIIKYNKKIQEKLQKDIKDYKTYGEIIIEIIPINNRDKNYFINYAEEHKYYHIYFNDENEEKKRNYFTKNENISKIKIIIDSQVKSFWNLFDYCDCIEKINFINFRRKNINDMESMFSRCHSLIELNLNNFHTNNVTSMA